MPSHLAARAVLFDMDGVLVDSTGAIEQRWTAWAERCGLPVADVVRSGHGVPIRQVVAQFVSADLVAGETAWMEAMSEEPAPSVAMPGALSALTQTHLPLAVATSATRVAAQQRLTAAGLPVPAVLITSQDVVLGKPDPAPYLAAAAALGIDIADCVVFEDAPAGLQSARAAGATPIALATSHRPDELGAGHAVVANLASVSFTDDGVEWTSI